MRRGCPSSRRAFAFLEQRCRAGDTFGAAGAVPVGAGAGVQPQRVDASVAALSAGPALPARHPQLSVRDAGAGVAAEAGGGPAAGGRAPRLPHSALRVQGGHRGQAARPVPAAHHAEPAAAHGRRVMVAAPRAAPGAQLHGLSRGRVEDHRVAARLCRPPAREAPHQVKAALQLSARVEGSRQQRVPSHRPPGPARTPRGPRQRHAAPTPPPRDAGSLAPRRPVVAQQPPPHRQRERCKVKVAKHGLPWRPETRVAAGGRRPLGEVRDNPGRLSAAGGRSAAGSPAGLLRYQSCELIGGAGGALQGRERHWLLTAPALPREEGEGEAADGRALAWESGDLGSGPGRAPDSQGESL